MTGLRRNGKKSTYYNSDFDRGCHDVRSSLICAAVKSSISCTNRRAAKGSDDHLLGEQKFGGMSPAIP